MIRAFPVGDTSETVVGGPLGYWRRSATTRGAARAGHESLASCGLLRPRARMRRGAWPGGPRGPCAVWRRCRAHGAGVNRSGFPGAVHFPTSGKSWPDWSKVTGPLRPGRGLQPSAPRDERELKLRIPANSPSAETRAETVETAQG